MWTKYRNWKHVSFPVMLALGWWLLKAYPEMSSAWLAGIVIIAALVLFYLVEEVVWITKQQGRPCGSCGERVKIKSFRVQTVCPHCGETL